MLDTMRGGGGGGISSSSDVSLVAVYGGDDGGFGLACRDFAGSGAGGWLWRTEVIQGNITVRATESYNFSLLTMGL